jgi:alkylated DNA repair dioxygenase AlkB
MPPLFRDLAVCAAAEGGFENYDPHGCLFNRYARGSKLGFHRDRDEQDRWAPIVSVSFGIPAVFLWGGKRRTDKIRRLRLENGDVAVWGGPGRIHHGVRRSSPATTRRLVRCASTSRSVRCSHRKPPPAASMTPPGCHRQYRMRQ